ncbi:hypothetical protein LMH87_005349 [Akanthomyces muscarius]|uniref:Autophagy-related protein n=1 Tax=Akanthomyces muscarius TaxID=2231603 RepID=A0A9W8QNN1_AKAMU|nr:hypothetical protein LMH87_005349 [Akanthomyces muscarius]KAJ4163632.1 hypothetical protein LMH87_005349 [Akanthomyces muscarius]
MAAEQALTLRKPDRKDDRVDDATTNPNVERQIAMPVLQEEEIATTSKWEIWSWYAYYVGANGIGPFNFAPTAFQNLLSQAATASGPNTGSLTFAGRERDINSTVLLCNGLSFGIQTALFLVIGAYADFGTGRRWLLLGTSILAYAVGFAWIGVHDAGQWKIAAALYMAGSITYQLTTAYWIAAFPSLARNTQYLKDSRSEYSSGAISYEELSRRDELERSRLSNVAFWAQSVVELFLLAIIIGIMFGIKNGAANDNNWALSVLITFATAYWVVLSIPWFFVEKTRPGLEIPPAVGISAFWFVQKRYNLRPKTMFCVIMVAVILLDAWGMVGNWTTNFGGFQTVPEIWAYQVFYGLFVCPWYSYAQIMISSVTPRGYEYLFFSVFSVIGKASSLTGPLISSAIIDATPGAGAKSNRTPFYFLFALSLVSALGLFLFLDLDQSAKEQSDFLEEKAARAYGVCGEGGKQDYAKRD